MDLQNSIPPEWRPDFLLKWGEEGDAGCGNDDHIVTTHSFEKTVSNTTEKDITFRQPDENQLRLKRNYILATAVIFEEQEDQEEDQVVIRHTSTTTSMSGTGRTLTRDLARPAVSDTEAGNDGSLVTGSSPNDAPQEEGILLSPAVSGSPWNRSADDTPFPVLVPQSDARATNILKRATDVLECWQPHLPAAVGVFPRNRSADEALFPPPQADARAADILKRAMETLEWQPHSPALGGSSRKRSADEASFPPPQSDARATDILKRATETLEWKYRAQWQGLDLLLE